METRSARFRPTLILLRSEMFSRAVLPALPVPGVAPVHFTPDDTFYDLPETAALPDCAVALLARAGSWSARNKKDGFVPAPKLAGFTSDPVQASDALVRCRWWRRAKGGFQFTDWPGWLRAAGSTEAGEDAAIEQRRAAERERQRRRRDRLAAESAEPPRKRGRPAKPQVKNVSRDINNLSRDGITGHVTDPYRSDLDSDFNQGSEGQSVNPVEDRNAGAQAREKPPDLVPYTREFRLQVQGEMAARNHGDVTDAEADGITAEVLGRSKEPVPHPWGYVRKAIRGEKDPCARWLSKRPPKPAAILAEFSPAIGPHEFQRDPGTGGCARCREPQQDKIHRVKKAAVS